MIKRERIRSLRLMGLGLLAMLLVWISGGVIFPAFSPPVLSQVPSPILETPKHYTELEFPPLPDVQLPEYERYELDNGMVVYLVEDHELPLVSGSALIRTGSRLESGNKVGLTDIVGTVMRSGGTEEHPPELLNQMLEQRAASVETSIGTSAGSVSFEALTEDLETVFDLFTEVLRSPAFPVDKLELAKTQLQGGIARRNDDPNDIASREFRKLVYGEQSPYARTVEYETLDNITREDVVNFYQKNISPDRIILGIVGDFQPQEMRSLIETRLGDWQNSSPQTDLEVPQASQVEAGNLFFVEQEQLTQSYIFMGHLGGTLASPDYPALSVLNGVLSGFGGRLFNEVRSRQGLAYSVYGYWSPRYDYPGLFLAGGQTRSEATVPFVKAIFGEIDKIRTTPITTQELANAKESILNSFVFNFQNPSQTLSRLIRYEYYDYPEDFIFQYQQGVKNTTIEDVQRVAQQYLQPDQIVTLVVGNSNQIQPSLRSLGTEVKTVDVSIPNPQNS